MPKTATSAAAIPAPPSNAKLLSPDVDFQVTLALETNAKPSVLVTLAARKEEAPLLVWQAQNVLEFTKAPEAKDEMGAISINVESVSGKTILTLQRPPVGTVWLSYAVESKIPGYPDVPLVSIDPDRFEGAGEAMLAIPIAFESKNVRTVVRIETDEISTKELAQAASSFGHGSRIETTIRGGDLRQGLFVAGLMGRGAFFAPEGNDEAVWLGYTAFDPRPVFADMASTRTALKLLFRDADADKVTFLFLSDSRPIGAFAITRRPRSVIARIGVAERWSAPLRIAVATSVVHGWIGSRLWIGPNDPAHEAEAYWFTEGVARYLARDLLFRYGLISPQDSADEVNGLLSVIATSKMSGLSNEMLAKKTKAAIPLLIARGAIYAVGVNARLQRKPRGGPGGGAGRSLDNVLSELYAEAKKQASALPVSAWLDLLAKDLGPKENVIFSDAIVVGNKFDLVGNALGPCFQKVSQSYTGFELGFDEEATTQSKPQKLAGLIANGPAEKAGLREGDNVVSIFVGGRSPSEPVRITIARGEENKTFTYTPQGRTVKGIGFERKKGVSDDACSTE